MYYITLTHQFQLSVERTFWLLTYRCQCEVARACLRGIRSFAHSKTSATTFDFTVTLILTFLLPNFTVIVTFPDFFAFTTPFEETVTTFLLEEV